MQRNAKSSDQPWLLTRRLALNSLLALAIGLPTLGDEALAQRSNESRRVDFHHHFFPPGAKDLFPPFPSIAGSSAESSLAAMDEAGVQTAFLSLPVRLGDDPVVIRKTAITLAREANELGARYKSDHPGRFGLFAFLPMPDIDASLREIEYAFETLGADGVGLLTSYGNHWPGDAAFQPVFDELNRRKAVVFFHPTDGPCCHNLMPDTRPNTIEWNTDTSRAIWSLINDGEEEATLRAQGNWTPESAAQIEPVTSMATRYSDTSFLWSHGGGSLLGLVGRILGNSGTTPADLSPAPEVNSRLFHLRRFFYDTASSANSVEMQGLKALVGTSQILFGTDYPFVPIQFAIDGLLASGLTRSDLNAIDRGNALRLFPGLDDHL